MNTHNFVTNPNLTYEELELFISRLNYSDLIIQDIHKNTPLMLLCLNLSLTYLFLN